MAEKPKRKIPGLFLFLSVAFLNAMVDLGHKITVQNSIFKIYDDAAQVALTAVVNALILLPFILLFTPAGFLSDRFYKPRIMQITAFSAVIITSLITLSYYQGWFEFAFAMTFVLAAQSAIYSPAKYGYIREIADKPQIAPANGFVQATTIVAILTGIFVFTVLFETLLTGKSYQNEAELIQHIAPLGWGLVILSILEFMFASRLPKPVKPQTAIAFDWAAYRRGQLLKTNLKRVTHNRLILYAIFGLSLFWGLSQTLLATFPAFAKIRLAEDNTIVIQGLLACSGVGIIAGSLLGGRLNREVIQFRQVLIGAAGLLFMLWLIPTLSDVVSFALAIVAFGFFGGLLIIPLNAYIQLTAPMDELGKVLAGNNWVQNVTMVSFLILTYLVAEAETQSADFLGWLPWLALSLMLPLLWRLRPITMVVDISQKR